VAACVAAVTGIIPAIRAVDASGGLKDSSPAATPSRYGRRLEQTLCVAQVAIAMVLLIGASLLARSLVRLLHVDIGVSTAHVLTASMNLAYGQRPTDQETLARVDRVVQRISALPGVRAVGVGTSVPPSMSRIQITLRRRGDAVDYAASAVASTPGYFAALQARLLAGRFFTEADDAQHPQVMIMSEDTARRFFGSTAAIGRTMSLPALRNGKNTSVDMTLVGIIANVKYSGLSTQAGDAVYRPFAQQVWVAPFLLVRTIGDPLEFASSLRREIGQVDRGIVISSVETLEDRVAADAAQPRFRTVLLVSLAGLALAIAAVGLSGVIAYTVSHRTREIGIRMALGATSGDVLRMVMRDGVVVALGGLAAGFAGALVVTRTLTTVLFGVTPTDALSFATASAALLSITLVASYLPARRAARVDPMVILRAE
jgi:putative ABC transport system permease protein